MTKNTRRRLAAGLVSLAALAALLSAPVGAAEALKWGVNAGSLTNQTIPVRAQFALMEDLGLTAYRVKLTQSSDARAMTELAGLARNDRVEIVAVLAPDLDFDNGTPRSLYSKAFNFAAAFAAKFKADITAWQLGEGYEEYALVRPCETKDDGKLHDCKSESPDGVSALHYIGERWRKVSHALKGLSDGVIAANPGARRILPTGGAAIRIGAFERLNSDGVQWDATAVRLDRELPENELSMLAAFRRPIWIVDLQYANREGESDADSLRRMTTALTAKSADYGISAIFLNKLIDDPSGALTGSKGPGLVALARNENGELALADANPIRSTIRTIVLGKP